MVRIQVAQAMAFHTSWKRQCTSYLPWNRWNVAFNLARDLKLNQEVEIFNPYHALVNHTFNCQCTVSPEIGSDSISEVHREERRRTWWLLFLMDRHLALCYNRTLALLEAECRDLLLPLDDITWQNASQLHSHGIKANGPRCMLLPMGTGRMNGPPITCTGPGLFEFFLPLMTTTGHYWIITEPKTTQFWLPPGPPSGVLKRDKSSVSSISTRRAWTVFLARCISCTGVGRKRTEPGRRPQHPSPRIPKEGTSHER